MATIKHIPSKNADYGAAEAYLTFEHDEFTMKPTLDEQGRLIPRQDYRLDTLNCDGEDFALSCIRANLRYGKNSKREDIKSHHYIISFDPRDAADNGLTVDRAQALGLAYCKEHFPGHQALVCTHPDGHNHSGNIHVHIVINSLRIAGVERKPYMDRASDTRAGDKHRCTAAAMRYFRSEVMEMCHREGLYQIDLLNGSRNKVTEREYWAKRKGQTKLDKAKAITGGVNYILGKSVAEQDLPDKEKTQNIYIKEALLLKQALSLCGSLVDEKTRFEAAFFESVRTMIVRLLSGGTGKKFTLPEVNERINELLKHSIKSEGVINLFSDVKAEFSLFDPKFLEEIANMKEKNLAVELLKKLIAEQVSVYRRTNIVKSEKFSELIQGAMNRYLNGMLTNEEVIQELLKLAKEIADANAEGEKLGLTSDELAFYDALTKPQAIKDFYEHDELIAITKELTDLLRKNRTIDWQKKESARAGMRRLVKRLLKKHKYPPEGMDDAVQTVMSQCEMWTDNVMILPCG